jgi:hypothetical protein
MSCAIAITPAILDTILGRLALLFLSGADGDLPTARHAASRMLAAYHAETPDELRLPPRSSVSACTRWKPSAKPRLRTWR